MLKTPADLRDPIGDITLDMFPEDDDASLAIKLQAYLDRGYDLAGVAIPLPPFPTTIDDAAAAWAYHIAFSAVAARLAAAYANAALTGLGSLGISSSQIAYFERRAKEALSEWELLTASGVGTSDQPRASEAVVNAFAWW